MYSILAPGIDLGVENIALRQQLIAFKKEKPRPKLTRFGRIFWVWLRRIWRHWAGSLMIVKPETVTTTTRTGRIIVLTKIRLSIVRFLKENRTTTR